MSGLLSNALSGLNAANAALSVSGHNVANLATEGYSRQAVQFATAQGNLNGVKVSNVDRVVNSFYNDDIWRTSSDLAYYNGLQSYLGYAEELMGTSSLNFNDAISQVTGALNSALAAPESRAYRQEVLSSADALVNKMSQINGALTDQREKLSKEMTQTASSIGYTLRKLADYNDRVAVAVAKGEPTAELEDNRELLVTQLSSYIGIATTSHDDGTLDISTLSGAPLLIGTQAAELAVNGTEVSLTLGKQVFRLTDSIGGKIGGLIAADTGVLQPTVASLNDMLSQLSDEVNGVLAQGFDLNGNPGAPLFSYDANDPLGTFAVSDSITIDSLAFIGGKDDGSGNWVAAGGVGDNSNIANLIKVFGNQSDDYSLLIGRLASKSNENQSNVKTAQALSDNAVQTRDNLSGVNKDEEASNILFYQQMYQANAKVISVADETFKTLLAMF